MGRQIRLPGRGANGALVAAGEGAVGGEGREREDGDRLLVSSREERQGWVRRGLPGALV